MVAEHVRSAFAAFIFAALLALAGAQVSFAQSAKSAAGKAAAEKVSASVCLRCHESGLPLPAAHPKVKGASLAECASCHPSQVGQAKPYAFATRLHNAHATAQLDCTGCHAYVPGKQFATATGKGNLGALDIQQYERLHKAVASAASSKGLAAIHSTKQNLSCGACHGKQLIPDDNETVVNKQCVACHGGYDKLAVLTKAKLKNPDINPHGSHLGTQIACTVCHQGHVESKAYCLNCHTNFTMPMR